MSFGEDKNFSGIMGSTSKLDSTKQKKHHVYGSFGGGVGGVSSNFSDVQSADILSSQQATTLQL